MAKRIFFDMPARLSVDHRTRFLKKWSHGRLDSGCQAEIAPESATRNLIPLKGAVTEVSIARELEHCDVIFGCTDDEWGRAVLTRIAPYYLIPVFDMGVQIDSESGRIKSVRGRVTTLIPGSPCLFCRGIVTADGIEAEVLSKTNPEEYKKRRKEGYISLSCRVPPRR